MKYIFLIQIWKEKNPQKISLYTKRVLNKENLLFLLDGTYFSQNFSN